MITSDSQVAVLSRVLDMASLRHRVIAQNVANVNTPGYQRHDVDFADSFARALADGKTSDVMQVQPRVIVASGGTARQDGNNVVMDVEMGQMQTNALLFQVFTQIMSMRLGQMRSAISGR